MSQHSSLKGSSKITAKRNVLKRYERVCFTREAVRPLDKPGAPFAVMLHPGGAV